MKSQLVLILFVTSIAANFITIESTDSEDTSFEISAEIREKDCGPFSFSERVKGAFLKKIKAQHSYHSELHNFKSWIIIINDDFCDKDLEYLFNLTLLEDYKSVELIEGTWRVTFQNGDVAFETLESWEKEGKLWGFYPETASTKNLRYEPNDPFYVSGDQWYLDNDGSNNGNAGIDINPQTVWEDYAGDGVIIGIIDDGLDYNNPDLSPNFLDSFSYDYCDGDEDVYPSEGEDGEVDWHGTAVAGIVSAKGNNSLGITGVSYNSGLVGIRLVAESCTAITDLDQSEAQALNHRLDMIDVYTGSWGAKDDGLTLGEIGPYSLTALERGVEEGRDGLGSVYVWAAGNGRLNLDNSNKDAYANSRYTIAVGSTNWKGELTNHSESGSNIMVVAPSNNSNGGTDPRIFTTDISGVEGHNITDYLDNMGGTSASASMVAGVVSLMLEANSNLTWRDVQHILVRTSKVIDIDNEGWFTTFKGREYNHAYGYGLVDASAAVNLAKDWETIGEEVSYSTEDIEVNEFINDERDEGVISKYFVNGSINIETVEVNVNISHGHRGDLNLFLESPNGVISELVRQSNDENDHYNDWVFSSVVHWDENSFGLWKLKVNDTLVGNAGTWKDWNMTFYGYPEEDTDSDNLTNFAEWRLGSDHLDPDFDNDGILDGDEYYGWYDASNNFHQTDFRIQDSDKDGATDWYEGFGNKTGLVTDPNDNDTDDDGLLDGCEIFGFDDSLCYNIHNYITNATNPDTDNDTISDFDEIYGINIDNFTSNPTEKDTDFDGMPDKYELSNHHNPRKQVDALEDADCDGIQVQFEDTDNDSVPDFCALLNDNSRRFTNYQEYLVGTNPRDTDSDSDGLLDGWEYFFGLNPLEDDAYLDLDNDTISNMYEYNNYLIESSIFSKSNPKIKAYWKFDSTDPSLVSDFINSNFGFFEGDAIKVEGKYGKGIYCDGDGDYLRLDSIQNNKFTEYTIQTWVKLTNYTTFGTIFGTVTDGRTWLGIDAEGYIQFKVFAGNTLYSTPLKNESKAKLDIWYHVAATYSETDDSLRLYVNGTLVANETISPLDSIKTAGDKNYICRGQNGEYLNGTVDNIALWSRAFTENEIRYFYERPLGIGAYSNFRVEDGIRYTNPNSTDTDGDGITDYEEFYYGLDGFLTDPTSNDTDSDGLDDLYEIQIHGTYPNNEDTDGDNVTDKFDVFPLDSSEWNDTDGDGFGDNGDHFPFDFNESQDSDLDGLGDNFEINNCFYGTNKDECTDPFSNDTDGDNFTDDIDVFPLNVTEWLDSDNDGHGDNSDRCPEDSRDYLDSDNDGFCDESDAFPLNPNEYLDSDSDGYGDNSDKYPTDASRYADPVQKVQKKDPLGQGTLDSVLPFIVLIGAVYFVYKYFRK